MSNLTVVHYVLVACFCGLVVGTMSAQPPRPLDAIAANLEPDSRLVYKTIDDQQLRLHIFAPRRLHGQDLRGVFLMIHGGGWTGGTARRCYPIADHFSRLGMIGVSLEYRLMSRDAGVTVFDCVKDARSAVRYLRSHAKQLHADPDRIVVAGASAGGHLAATTSLLDAMDHAGDDTSISCRADALVLYYPVIDTSEHGYGQQKIGERWRQLSPVHHVRAGLPPTIVFHGTSDTVAPYSGAVKFHERMERVGNQCQLVSHMDGAHGYFIFDLKLYEQVMDRTRSYLTSLGMIDQQSAR